MPAKSLKISRFVRVLTASRSNFDFLSNSGLDLNLLDFQNSSARRCRREAVDPTFSHDFILLACTIPLLYHCLPKQQPVNQTTKPCKTTSLRHCLRLAVRYYELSSLKSSNYFE